jgi:predicted MPP superfamily phosphohydrolase
MAGMSYGILSGAHDYRVRRLKVALPNLPQAFDGIRIAQLSDIHSGSFFNKIAVQGGIDMLLAEKPDVIFFTGDLVNNTADEMKDYFDIFKQVKAPLGVYSVLGNHDYGDYVQWASPQAKQKNLQTLMQTHADMGWQLLMNENKILKQGSEQIAILGIENWGAKGHFPKHGKLAEAYRGTEEAPVKLLLSHDPSHWDAQVRPEFGDIDIMFAGHTHGMQFGIEIGSFKWSPVQYMYEQWAGLYTKDNQHLYVNRGYGYLGFPGRIGMLPEITIMELVKA